MLSFRPARPPGIAGFDQGGAFLPDWDDLEQHVNSGRGGAGEVVADLRRRVDLARSAVLRALGDGYLAHGKAETAAGWLERGLSYRPATSRWSDPYRCMPAVRPHEPSRGVEEGIQPRLSV